MMQVSYDQETGIIRSVTSGFNTGAELYDYIAEFQALSKKAIARHGFRLHIVDAREAMVQSSDDAAKLRGLAAGDCRPGDRTAIIAASTLAKLQSTRIAPGIQYGFFADEAEAIAWLLSPQDLRKAG